ncbi:MAG TPA: fibronectin type III domain-containing protein [Bryobacteraceae bacterium]|nr:fibronectin type III domain-containing protein [Bryobacteraceae bacterium]
MRHFVLLLLFAAGAFAQAPAVTITGTDGLSHSVVRLGFDASGPFNFARSRSTISPASCAGGKGGLVQPLEKGGAYYTGVKMIVGGLRPATTYNICPEISADGKKWSSGVGTTIATLPLPAVHPAVPVPPATFDTSYPDTAGYATYTVASDCSDIGKAYVAAIARQATQGTVINLPAGTVCTAGNYQFASKPPDVQTWLPANVNVSAGTITLGGTPKLTENQGVVFGRSYAALVSYPASTSCEFGAGIVSGQVYYVHVVDSATNTVQLKCSDRTTPMVFTSQGVNKAQGFYWAPFPRALKYIIVRSATPDSQLPPEHTRITPAWKSKMASFVSPVSNVGVLGFTSTVLMFGSNDGNYENMTSSIRIGPGIEVTTADSPEAHTASDPLTWYNLIVSYPNDSNIIFDRTYIHGQGTPNRITRGWFWDGLNMGLVDSYLDGLVYYHSEYSGLAAKKTSNTTLTVAAGVHNMGQGPVPVSAPRAITIAGSGSGRAFIGLDMTHANAFTVWLPAGLAAACSGGSCASGVVTGTTNNTCGNGDAWQKDSVGQTNVGVIACVDISSGSITRVMAADSRDSVAGSQEGSSFMIGGLGPGPYAAINNYIEGAGLTWHHDDGGGYARIRGDYTYMRNHFKAPLTYMYGSATSDGLSYFMRQQLEWKGGRRINFNGNIMDGQWVEITPASVFLALTSINGEGITDIDIQNNTFRHGPGVTNTGIATPGRSEPQTLPILRFRFQNNLAWDIGSSYYWVPRQAAAPTGWMLEGPTGNEDVIVDHNTMVGNSGRAPTVMWLFDTNTEGVSVTNNIFSIDSTWHGLAQDGSEPIGACTGLLGKALADCKFTPSYVWKDNLMIGNHATRSEVMEYWPGLQNYFPKNQSLSAVGWLNYQAPLTVLGNTQNTDYHLKANWCQDCKNPPGDGRSVGADIDILDAAQGAVKLVGTPDAQLTQTSAAVTFVAPDSMGCPVDYSSSDAAVMANFTRVNDPGGARARTISLTDLSPGTLYHFRVNCAVEQPTGSFRTR